MSYIQDGLYIGGIDDAMDSSYLRKKGITQILTIHIKPIPFEYRENFQYKWISAKDMASQDLLFHFPECIEFIENGTENGGTLVHCEHGISRSVTIATAYLMKKLSLSSAKTLDLIKKHRPGVRPNSGFRRQLRIFENMHFKIDDRNSEFKTYKLEHLADKISSGVSLKDEDLKVQLARDPSSDKGKDFTYSDPIYYCGKCRKPLFYDNSIILHDNVKTAETCNSSLFIEPVKWMENDIQNVEGKVYCPKCKAKLGRFNWSGSKCTCGSWVTPAFHIRSEMVYRPVTLS